MKKLTLPILVLFLAACNLFQTNVQPIPTPTALQQAPTTTILASATASPTDLPLPSATTPPTDIPLPTSTLAAPAASPQPAATPHFKVGEAIKITTLHMLSATDGWGLSGPSVLMTRDGGRTWREVTPPELFPDGVEVEAFGAFPDVQTAWVIFSLDSKISPEASVWYTSDAGQTWTAGPALSHTVYGDVVWAEFATFDTSTGWMAIRGAWAGAGSHFNAQLYRTTDGGGTWNLLTAPDTMDIASQDFTGLVFNAKQTGWLTWQFFGAYMSWPASYATTSDGGSTWVSHDLPVPADNPDLYNKYWYCNPYQTNLLSATSVRLLVACSGNDLPDIGYLYATENGGSTWQTHALPVVPKMNQGDELIFFDPNHAYLLGQSMYSTTDGGLTWKLITTVAWDHAQFDLITDQVGWAIVSIGDLPSALVKTSNGGKTWQEIKPVVGP
jgi:photosystem II stability/assembly factor-like uncharacterized protein